LDPAGVKRRVIDIEYRLTGITLTLLTSGGELLRFPVEALSPAPPIEFTPLGSDTPTANDRLIVLANGASAGIRAGTVLRPADPIRVTSGMIDCIVGSGVRAVPLDQVAVFDGFQPGDIVACTTAHWSIDHGDVFAVLALEGDNLRGHMIHGELGHRDRAYCWTLRQSMVRLVLNGRSRATLEWWTKERPLTEKVEYAEETAQLAEGRASRANQELRNFKEQVRSRMIAEAEERGWCDEFDDILVEFGLDPRNREYDVTVTRTLVWRRTVSAASDEAAEELAADLELDPFDADDESTDIEVCEA